MNAEEVVEMIDAITEGKYYAHSFPTQEGSHSLSIETGTNAEDERNAPNEFWFSSFDAQFLAKIDDPRTAREIAGALVAWATRKETDGWVPRGAIGRLNIMASGERPDANSV